MPADLPPTIVCEVVHVRDADTFVCKTGEVIRPAGISALERSGRCNSAPDCPTMPYARAKAIATRIALGRTYTMVTYGRSGKRFVADNARLRCAILASGAAVVWRRYYRKYSLRRCS